MFYAFLCTEGCKIEDCKGTILYKNRLFNKNELFVLFTLKKKVTKSSNRQIIILISNKSC